MKGDPVREGWRWVGFGVTASWPGVTRIHLLPPLLPRASLSLFLFSSSDDSFPCLSFLLVDVTYPRMYEMDPRIT